MSNIGRDCSSTSSLSRTTREIIVDVEGINDGRQLHLSDLPVCGFHFTNPHAQDALQVCKELSMKTGLCLPNCDDIVSLNRYLFPEASKDRLLFANKVLCLLFYIDDRYDIHFSNHSMSEMQAFSKIIDEVCLSVIEGVIPHGKNVPYSFAVEIHEQLQSIAKPVLVTRFNTAFREHLAQGVIPSRVEEKNTTLSFEEYMGFRIVDSALPLLTTCIEITNVLCLPDHVHEHDKIKEMKHLASRIGTVVNDLYSYAKEVIALGTQNNIIPILMHENSCCFNEAVHKAVFMICSDALRFNYLEKEVRNWDIDKKETICCFVEGLKDLIIGCLHWHATSNRYRSAISPFPELRE